MIKTYLLMQLEMSEHITKTHNPSRFPSISEQIERRPSITGPTQIKTAVITVINTQFRALLSATPQTFYVNT